MFDVLDIGASGLAAQRTRLDVIAANIANAATTRDTEGRANPFRRRLAVFAAGRADNKNAPGVHVQQIKQDLSPFVKKFEPGHPDADAQGYVRYPNVDLAVEYVNALEASRAYEANVTMMETTKAMLNASLRLLA
jgi:flagellar basal-body rod protein FlgC